MQKITSFVLAYAPRLLKGEAVAARHPRNAPKYFEASVPHQHVLGEERREVRGNELTFFVRAYLPNVVLVEVVAPVDNAFSDDALALRSELVNFANDIATSHGGHHSLREEFSIALVSGYKGSPDELLREHKARIASFLKSETATLDPQEVDYALSFELKYQKNDAVFIDWDGAFVFDPEGDIDAVVELMELANFQLLQYRVLASELDERLKKVANLMQTSILVHKPLKLTSREVTQSFGEIIHVHAKSIVEFEAIEREVKLIGEWYSARLYDLLAKKFRLDSWKTLIKGKLDSLENIYSLVSENFGISRIHRLEFIQIFAFFILQIGWFALIILEFFYFTR